MTKTGNSVKNTDPAQMAASPAGHGPQSSDGNRPYYQQMAASLANSPREASDRIRKILVSDSLVSLFENVPDYRQTGKITYKLADLLSLAFLTICTEGSCEFATIEEHVRYNADYYEQLGLIHNGQIPSHDTFRQVFSHIDPAAFRSQVIWALYNLVKSEGAEGVEMFNVDGKEICGTGRAKNTKNPQRNVNVLNVYDVKNRINIVATPVDSKTNEIPAAREALYHLDLKGVYVTADALHTCEETCQLISMKKGYYVFPVKDKRTAAFKQISSIFEDPRVRSRRTVEKADRTFEICKLGQARKIDSYPKARLAVRMISYTRSGEPTVMYFISNSAKEDCVLEAICRRWEIENELHKLKDSSLINEDGIRFRDKTALQNMTVMTDLIAMLVQMVMALEPGRSMKFAKWDMKHYPLQTMQKVLSQLGDEEFLRRLREPRPRRVRRKKKEEQTE